MSKIWLITKREFLTRIKKRSFIIMSILGPIIFAGFFAFMFYMATAEETDLKKIAVCDETSGFLNKMPSNKYYKFVYFPMEKLASLKKTLNETEYCGILYIMSISPNSPGGIQFFSYKEPGLATIQYISNAIEKEIRVQKLLKYNIKDLDNIINSVNSSSNISVETVKLSESGEEKVSDKGIKMGVAYVSSFLIYIFILTYGVQVMRGVIEEKSSRIVEVIISSVKPFQLMMGKVLGVAMTAIMQFAIWIVLSALFITLVKSAFTPDMTAASLANHPQSLMDASKSVTQAPPASQITPALAEAFSKLEAIDFFVTISVFLFYFVGGYLLYASLFAAVGAAVDNDADTQQFVFPITLPLIIGIIVMINAFQTPDSSIAFWFSMIPFTSPIVMLSRVAYHVPIVQLVTSMIILVITFVAAIWFAGKIYRTGILMYGNKASFKVLWKWLKYKN